MEQLLNNTKTTDLHATRFVSFPEVRKGSHVNEGPVHNFACLSARRTCVQAKPLKGSLALAANFVNLQMPTGRQVGGLPNSKAETNQMSCLLALSMKYVDEQIQIEWREREWMTKFGEDDPHNENPRPRLLTTVEWGSSLWSMCVLRSENL